MSSYTNKKYKHFFLILLLVSILIIFSLPFLLNFSKETRKHYEKFNFNDIINLKSVKLLAENHDSTTIATTNRECTYWNCLNISKCGHTGHERISIYVYPLKNYIDENGHYASEKPISKEYYMILKTIVESKYYTYNPHEACLFVPSIDTLNENRMNLNVTSRALNQLPYWSNGENHLIFTMLTNESSNFTSLINFNIGSAVIIGAGFDTYKIRKNFDISLPLYSPIAEFGEVKHINQERTWFSISSQLNIDPYYLDELNKLSLIYPSSKLLIIDRCTPHNYTRRCNLYNNNNTYYSYPDILTKSTFCLIFRGKQISQYILLEAMAANCIPVILIDNYIMPFSNVLDWNRIAIFIMESHINTVMDVLNKISIKRINEMRTSLLYLYKKYFATMEKIILTSLDIMQDRIYGYRAKTYDEWNRQPEDVNYNPLFYPFTTSKSIGFTAVILTYDRIDSLYKLIERLSKVPSLMRIVVVWNNQKKSPPKLNEFPKISKSLEIIKSTSNRLSNRFYPYKQIETDAILHIDDDIVMLTSDEIEFAYEVWREFPDRIVGFPSRTHIWENLTQTWRYESEWRNDISMVLTGAAFLHKYWSYYYTYKMPPNIIKWIDKNMNCEDIAMNFLVANITNKPVIKVTPRKKFKCPECINNEMLSADKGHMIVRSTCVDKFAKIFGRMPLKSIEFRADPVLYKDTFPKKLKRFNNIGSL